MTVDERIDVWLKKEGFVPANHLGVALKEPLDYKGIGLLLPDYLPRKGLLSWLKKPRRPLIATIWWGNFSFSIKADEQNWLIQVFGRNQLLAMKDLKERIEDRYHVKVRVELASEMHKEESFEHEYGI